VLTLRHYAENRRSRPVHHFQVPEGMTSPPLSDTDLDHVVQHTRPLWEEARGARIFLTGGTGFFGAWLVQSFLHANSRLDLGASLVVLTRDRDAARRRLPCLAEGPSVALHPGDVKDFSPPGGTFDFVIHAATESSRQIHAGDDRHMFDTILDGTRRVLAFAREHHARRLLLVSSGAVYGRQPADIDRLSERFWGGPDVWDSRSAYAEGKRAAELLCAIEAGLGAVSTCAARCFAFVGPHLPLDAHFAIGNFIGDALAGRPLHVRGDGTAIRSYLYTADLAVWLWTMALSPAATGAYNVGSTQPISIEETARLVASLCAPSTPIVIGARPEPGATPHRYVADTSRAHRELGLRQLVSLEDAIDRTAAWHRRPLLTQPRE
jgi:nucleoside-diphosphate-sugar epimerase